MANPTRTPRYWRRAVNRSFAPLASWLLSAALGATSVGCSVLENLDELDNDLSQDAGASRDPAPAPGPMPVGTDTDEAQDSAVAEADGATGQTPALDGAHAPIEADAAGPPTIAPDGSDLVAASAGGDADAQGGRMRLADGSQDVQDLDASDAGTVTGSIDAQDAGGWCASHRSAITIDCHDFDEGQTAQYGFTNHYYTGRFASVTSTDFAPGSPPSSLLVSTPLLDAGEAPQYEQFNDIFAFHNKVELSFALKIVNYDPDAGYISPFRFSYQNGSWAAELDFEQTRAFFNESTALPDGGTRHSTYAAAQPSPLDAWTNVDCVFDLTNHTVSLSYDGVAVVTEQAITNPGQDAPAIFVQVGLNFLVSPAVPMMLYYDDIVLSTPP